MTRKDPFTEARDRHDHVPLSGGKIKRRDLSAMNKPSLPLDLKKLHGNVPEASSTPGNTNRQPSKRGAMTNKPDLPGLGAKIQSVRQGPHILGPGELPEPEEREPQKSQFFIPIPERQKPTNKVALEKPPDKQGASCPGDASACQGIDSVSQRFLVGYADTCGLRPTMEDKLAIKGQFRGRKDEDFFAVFDGHGGTAAALYAAKGLSKNLEKQLELFDDDEDAVIRCLHDSFLDCHTEMQQSITESGTTGVIAYIQRDRFFIANVGDSRIVVCQGGRSKPLSIDQKPNLPPEKRRISRLGGWVTGGRVQSRLAVARALGDFVLNPYICCEPEVFGPWHFSPSGQSTNENQNYEFMVLACDGLWDVCGNEQAVEIVCQHQTPQEGAEALRLFAVDNGTKDNVSILVLFFPGYVPGKYVKPKESSSESSSEESSSCSGSSSSGSSEESSEESSEGEEAKVFPQPVILAVPIEKKVPKFAGMGISIPKKIAEVPTNDIASVEAPTTNAVPPVFDKIEEPKIEVQEKLPELPSAVQRTTQEQLGQIHFADVPPRTITNTTVH